MVGNNPNNTTHAARRSGGSRPISPLSMAKTKPQKRKKKRV
jgi:hypothetical protein